MFVPSSYHSFRILAAALPVGRSALAAVATLLAAERQLEQFAKLPDSGANAAAARALFSQSLKGIAEAQRVYAVRKDGA